jgi:hypothetical protein
MEESNWRGAYPSWRAGPQKKKKKKKEEDIIRMIKVTQLQCTGHLQRMGNNEIHRRIMDFTLEGKDSTET